MSVERNVLLSLLRLTQSGQVRKERLIRDARVPAQTADHALAKLFHHGHFCEHEGLIEASPNQRVKMAVHALRLGADFERVCALLSWTEFESIAAQAFEANDYQAIRNFRFKQASRKWEIDVIGLRKPLILCVDCKHWRRGWRKAATVRAVDAQIQRTQALTNALPNYHQKLRVAQWASARLIPIVLSLASGPYKFYDDVPIVPVLQLQDFLNDLPAEAQLLKSFLQKHVRLDENLQNFNQ